jgi:NTE family protein
MKRVGLALGGGGAKGLSHIAFLQALDEVGVRPVVIAGTSIGAVIGGLYAAGVTGRQLEQLVKDLGFKDLWRRYQIDKAGQGLTNSRFSPKLSALLLS